jgi:hypothetical protein
VSCYGGVTGGAATVAARLGITLRDPVLRLRHLCRAGDQALLVCAETYSG